MAITEPQRIAFPFGVINPSQRPKVPSPAAYAACRSDQVEAKLYLSDVVVCQRGEAKGASALYPFSLSFSTT
ncbi:MAG: hypothetical protein ACE5OZ_09225 [Candidatus Heimdallarchaeota archaeon]